MINVNNTREKELDAVLERFLFIKIHSWFCFTLYQERTNKPFFPKEYQSFSKEKQNFNLMIHFC